MAEEAAIVEQPKVEYNPLWDDFKPEGYVEPVKADPAKQQEAAKAEIPAFDVNAFLKENFGWDNVDAAKNEYTELKKLKDQPTREELKFANEESERLFNAIKEGKQEEAYELMSQQKNLKKLSELDVNSRNNAEQVLKAQLQNQYKELQPDEIDYLLQEKYPVPEKPEAGLDQTEAEYADTLKAWEKKVSMIEKRMSIDAKLAKPELAKLQKEIVLPDIPKSTSQPKIDQKELENIQAARDRFLQAVNSDYLKDNGFNVTVKDKDAGDVQISYTLSNEEKAALKPLVENFNADEYFTNRWFTKEGTPNVAQMMKDLFLLENPEKAFQKFGSEGINKNKAHNILDVSNIDLSGKNGGRTTQTEQTQQMAERQKKMEESLWD